MPSQLRQPGNRRRFCMGHVATAQKNKTKDCVGLSRLLLRLTWRVTRVVRLAVGGRCGDQLLNDMIANIFYCHAFCQAVVNHRFQPAEIIVGSQPDQQHGIGTGNSLPNGREYILDLDV
jgi:hypothetical protein